MRDPLYRTCTTWLTDDQLVLLDVLFAVRVPFQSLRRENFLKQWNLGYTHGLDDGKLQSSIGQLCKDGVLETYYDGGNTWFQMTSDGGELWAQERCPVWERYCTERYTMTSRGRTLMSVRAVSPQVRDHFLALWPPCPARRKTAVISDRHLIAWHPFPRVYVGIATYEESTSDEQADWAERGRQHWAVLERERTWWRRVPELQRFVLKPSEPDAPA